MSLINVLCFIFFLIEFCHMNAFTVDRACLTIVSWNSEAPKWCGSSAIFVENNSLCFLFPRRFIKSFFKLNKRENLLAFSAVEIYPYAFTQLYIVCVLLIYISHGEYFLESQDTRQAKTEVVHEGLTLAMQSQEEIEDSAQESSKPSIFWSFWECSPRSPLWKSTPDPIVLMSCFIVMLHLPKSWLYPHKTNVIIKHRNIEQPFLITQFQLYTLLKT